MYEIFEKLMKEFGYTAYKVSVETGIAQSTLLDWKKGKSIPKIDKIQKIADLFHVSVDYLMTGEEKEGGETYYINEETREIAQEIFEKKELRMLFDVTRKSTPQRLMAYYNMIKELESQEHGEE